MRLTVLFLIAVTGLAGLLAGCVATAQSERINSFELAGSFDLIGTGQVPPGITSLAVTSDGRTVMYGTASARGVGLVDFSNPGAPRPLATVSLGSTPAGIAITPGDSFALVADDAGFLHVVETDTGSVVRKISIAPGTRDISATLIDKRLVVVAANGEGLVQLLSFQDPADVVNAEVTIQDIDLRGLALSDPQQPDSTFLDVHGDRAAVALQRNNGLAIIDLEQATVISAYNLGTATERYTDLTADGAVVFDRRYPGDATGANAGARMPGSVAWSADGRRLFTADEGIGPGTGGHGWSVRNADGSGAADDGGSLEALAVGQGRFPEAASQLGIQLSRVDIGKYGGQEFAFFVSRGGSFLAVYELSEDPTKGDKFVQLTGLGRDLREVVAVPAANLVVTAGEDTGLTLFRGSSAKAGNTIQQPVLAGSAVLWGGLSGLAAEPGDSGVLFAVPDNAFPNQIFRIELTSDGGTIKGEFAAATAIRGQSHNLDPEGLAWDTSVAAPACPGFWIASEGNAQFGSPKYRPNLLVQVDCRGQVLREVSLPRNVDSPAGGLISRQGLEGVAVSPDGEFLLAAVKSQYTDEDLGNGGTLYTRIARYSLETERWDFFLYPITAMNYDSRDQGGLADIMSAGGGCYLALEREKLSDEYKLKRVRVYQFRLDEARAVPPDFVVTPDADLNGLVLSKTLLTGVVGDFRPTDNVEAITLDADGALWSIIDNDSEQLARPFTRHGILQQIPGASPCS